MKLCIACAHFRDAKYSRTYVSPRCNLRGDDDCAHMRSHVCTLDGIFYEPKDAKPHLDPQSVAIPRAHSD